MMTNIRPSGTDATRCDIAIIGGGVIGSAVAYFTQLLAPAASVVVLEQDSTYEFASTLRASGGARRQFSCPENIAMSNFSIPFIAEADEILAVDGDPAHVEWHAGGYLLIAGRDSVETLRDNFDAQCAGGVDADWLDGTALAARFPSMNVDDLVAGVHTRGDGWCDPNGLLQGLRRKARSLGVNYIDGRVIGIDHAAHVAHGVRLETGEVIAAENVVNAAGAWSQQISAMVGMPLPIEPLRRFEHYFDTPSALEPLPYIKDTARLAFRPEGRGYSGGLVDSLEPRGYNFDIDHGYFERVVWPALAHRFPVFEACRCRRTWSGLYEQNELDGNPVIGNWSGQMNNFYVVAGFSGHGMMHAPAAGRAIAELLVHGRFASLDLTRLSYGRIADNAPYPERGIV